MTKLDLKLFVLLDDGSIEPTHHGESEAYADLRNFEERGGSLYLNRPVSIETKNGYAVVDRESRVLETAYTAKKLQIDKDCMERSGRKFR